MNISISPRKSPRRKVGSIFARRKKGDQLLNGAPELEESSESSLELFSVETEDVKSHIGEPNITPIDVGVKNNTKSNDDSIKNLIVAYKSRPRPLGDTPAPPKPRRNLSFKMDGVPAFMNQQIEKNVRRDEERRRRRHRARSVAASAELHESLTSLSMPAPRSTQQQRPKVPFLNVPKDHPLYWDTSELPAADFPEDERIFLANVLKNPVNALSGQRLATRVQLVLRKIHLMDWDVATIGRVASELFHPNLNPLNLPPAVARYFFAKFDSLRNKLIEAEEVVYSDTVYSGKDEELFERLRCDFEEAVRRYETHQRRKSLTLA